MPTPNASGSPFSVEFGPSFGSGATAVPPRVTTVTVPVATLTALRGQVAQAVTALNTVYANLGKLLP